MFTLSHYFKHDSSYWGERGEWLVVTCVTRDSDCLARSNYRTFIKLLGGKGSEGGKGSQDINENLAIEEATHWACGWLQYLIINPECVELIQEATQALERLEDYPVLDDEDFSALEMEEANESWSYWSTKERIEYMRENRSQFSFHDFSDVLANARGKYFSGYASEILN